MQGYFEIKEEGHNIRCKLYYQDLNSIRRVVIFGHGFGSHQDKGAAREFAEQLMTAHGDAALISFDWPAHGVDEKQKLCLADCSAYLSLVIDYAREHFQTEELYSYTASFGGYLTLKFIAEHGNPFQKIALRCPAVNMYEVLTTTILNGEKLEKIRKGEEITYGVEREIRVTPSFLEELKNNDIQRWDFSNDTERMLILHGTEDEIVPFNATSAFADKNRIKFVPFDGADHRFSDPAKMDQAIKTILNFYAF